MDGILLVDKPASWTSHDVVAKVRSLLRQSGINKPKVGHAGTLDPLATGLLVILVGKYCKRASEFSKLDKIYEATIKLGFTSETGDEEGKKTKVNDKTPSLKQIQAVLMGFVGEIEQTPHQYSAVKVGGQRAYKLARAGKESKIEPRTIKVYSLEVTGYSYPEVKFTVEVSSGTYIRSLAEDIGKKLGTAAYLKNLKRTQVGYYKNSNAVNELNYDSVSAKLLLP